MLLSNIQHVKYCCITFGNIQHVLRIDIIRECYYSIKQLLVADSYSLLIYVTSSMDAMITFNKIVTSSHQSYRELCDVTVLHSVASQKVTAVWMHY